MRYTGNKNIAGVREQIKSLVQPYDLFVELFAGSAAVSHFLSAPPDKLWLNDLWPGAVEHFVYTGHGYKLTHLDAIDILKQFSSTDDQLQQFSSTGYQIIIFHDPPYEHSTRPNGTNLYQNEPDYDWHVEYLECIQKALHLQHIIIHPVCDLYNEKLKDWNYREVKIRYNRKTSIERIWFNFPEPVELIDYTSWGKNRTDRQRIKRQVNNFTKKLDLMPPVQRNYVLKLINERYNAK